MLLEILTVVALAVTGSPPPDPPMPDTVDTAMSPPADTSDTTIADTSQTEVIFKVSSSSFATAADIPTKYTCEGANLSPAITWAGAPSEAKSYVIIVDDPDAPDPAAPRHVFVHWVAYNIPGSVTRLPEGLKPGGLPRGGLDGVNDTKKAGYSGPCPILGKHRYYIKVYALDTVLPDLERPTKSQLLEAMNGHVVANAELMGMYERRRTARRVTR